MQDGNTFEQVGQAALIKCHHSVCQRYRLALLFTFDSRHTFWQTISLTSGDVRDVQKQKIKSKMGKNLMKKDQIRYG